MRILVTGANGFVGRHLTDRLRHGGLPITSLTLADVAFQAPAEDASVRIVSGDLADPAVAWRAVEDGVDCVFHLACMPGRAAETQYDEGRRANLFATMALLDALRASGGCPRFVFSSSVAVFGSPLPSEVTDATLPLPMLSYGSQKLMSEALVADYTRRGWVDGIALRLSGILARPPGAAANLSAFFSDVMHAARAGERFTMPVGPALTSWLMSVSCCVDNLLHGALLSPERLQARRAFTLPALRPSMDELVSALAALYGPHVRELIAFEPDSSLEAIFRQPPLRTEIADALGFRHDGTLTELIRRSLPALPEPDQPRGALAS